eukprot:CAMPEP_0176069304 /NCGR_PEP_ID=MMETSP0120_2-20121206/34601_1 /TAXON_ID=160619 /ORGANISM="Kryptoperidinium foliaceum, Strain CCMP 1326" /LENGTH=132 /DNA_ID=CAMNT_0017402935 /DNA_START=150 /DNA_END=548 /DNA_ORIENTATION=+
MNLPKGDVPQGAQEKVADTTVEEPKYEEPAAEAPRVEEPTVEEPKSSGLNIGFQTIGREKVNATFTKRPLGFSFKLSAPLSVTKVTPGGQADSLGVVPGMEIIDVQGQAICGVDGKCVMETLKAESANLPEA